MKTKVSWTKKQKEEKIGADGAMGGASYKYAWIRTEIVQLMIHLACQSNWTGNRCSQSLVNPHLEGPTINLLLWGEWERRGVSTEKLAARCTPQGQHEAGRKLDSISSFQRLLLKMRINIQSKTLPWPTYVCWSFHSVFLWDCAVLLLPQKLGSGIRLAGFHIEAG